MLLESFRDGRRDRIRPIAGDELNAAAVNTQSGLDGFGNALENLGAGKRRGKGARHLKKAIEASDLSFGAKTGRVLTAHPLHHVSIKYRGDEEERQADQQRWTVDGVPALEEPQRIHAGDEKRSAGDAPLRVPKARHDDAEKISDQKILRGRVAKQHAEKHENRVEPEKDRAEGLRVTVGNARDDEVAGEEKSDVEQMNRVGDGIGLAEQNHVSERGDQRPAKVNERLLRNLVHRFHSTGTPPQASCQV